MTVMSKSRRPTNVDGGYDEVQMHSARTEYRLDGKLHRLNGPAVISAQGDEHWYENGVRHRIGGPAVTTRNGAEQWWVYGKHTASVPLT